MRQQVEGKIEPISEETGSKCWQQPGLGLTAAAATVGSSLHSQRVPSLSPSPSLILLLIPIYSFK